MKYVKYFSIVIAGLFVMLGCQKELSLETGSVGGVAQGTLKDSLGDCQPITIHGQYFKDSLLTDSNYAVIQVNIASPGRYIISTDVQNGYKFSDTGYFSASGLQQVKLKSTGRPILPLTSDFTVTFGTSFCVFSVTAIPNVTGPLAVYTLAGTANNCTNAVVAGTYIAGTALNNTNTVNIQVNVTSPGSYIISTTETNGITFIGSGTFASTGLQNLTLSSSGTPIAGGATTIPITAGASSCNFTVNVLGGPGGNINLADSAWQFTQGGKIYHGSLDSVVFAPVNGIPVLQLFGLTYQSADSAFVMGMGMTGNNIQSGTYNTNTFAAFSFTDSTGARIVESNPTLVAPPVNVSIVLSYDSVTKIATGTFSGTALTKANVAVPITNGKFTAKVP